jgi:4-hydroxybenzoate polyprenyltransferase
VVLVTASHQQMADAIATHLQCFDEVHGTNEVNLSGRRKSDFLVSKYGPKYFDYIGDSRADAPVWQFARKKYVASDISEPLMGTAAPLKVSRRPLTKLLKTLRAQQWIKNLLVAIPVLTAHKIFDPVVVFNCILATVALSCLASATYILNDLLDLEADRAHSEKKNRAIASGEASIGQAVLLSAALLTSGLLGGFFFIPSAFGWLLLYEICTVFYSLHLKSKPVADILVLACLYTLRILIGGAATHIRISSWLLTFSVFLFVSLAAVKRVSELISTNANSVHIRRGYQPSDSLVLTAFGIGSGLVATLVLAFYVNSAEVLRMYASPQVLWLLCPLLLYWIGRIWILVGRNQLHHDPIVFVFRDKVSLCLLGICLCIVSGATVASKHLNDLFSQTP